MIKVFDHLKSFSHIEDEIMDALERVLYSGRLILGPETEAFEEEFAAFCGARFCIAVSSGTSALHLALVDLGIAPGDEVITVSNTCVPTIAAIRLTGALPLFVDVHHEDLTLDPELIHARIGRRTKCIIPVHLWGQSAMMDQIVSIANHYGIAVVEDCSQAHGAKYKGRQVGTFGDTGCFSFYPTKNLGAYGDAGAIITQDFEIAQRIKSLREYGYNTKKVSQIEGTNARMSEIQAAILRIKLNLLPAHLERRNEIASIYTHKLTNPSIKCPPRYPDRLHAYHQYVIRCKNRGDIADAFRAKDIEYGIHYPIPVHMMAAYSFLGGDTLSFPITETACHEILSLPIHPYLSEDEIETVVHTLNQVTS